MKHYLISEIIYWVIAIISLFSVFENWDKDPNRSYIFLGLVSLSVVSNVTVGGLFIVNLY